ncbi:MAG: hypothetical protein HY902_17925 [Deltaproteobacteria bacterium]|nr:hypothetical protein [Deltaproteobacteria bacterium]
MRFIPHVALISCLAGAPLLGVLGCGSTAAPSTTVEDDDTGVTDEDTQAGDGSGDSTACRGLGCQCHAPADCDSGFCKVGAGGLGVCVACVPSADPAEVCDGQDNDCDGATAEASCPGQGGCQVGVCQNKQCTLKKLSDIPCSDGDACTAGDSCAAGECQASPLVCDDHNVCTTDSCDKIEGCVYLPTDVTCSDGDACSLGDACQAGVCKGSSIKDCSDANPCTDDSCTHSSGACLALPNTATCDDGNPCTVGDGCIGGGCKPGTNVCPP